MTGTTETMTLRLSDALATLARQRDPAAWAALIEHSGQDILRVCRRILANAALAEDACQETLLQIRAHAGRFKPPARREDAELAARGWVMRVATYTALDLARSQNRMQRREREAAQMATHAPPGASAITAQMSAEQLDQLRREVAELPDSLRQPVVLHFFGNLDYSEVAVALACSPDAAKKRVQRGVERLRSRLALLGVALSLAQILTGLAGNPAQAAEAASAAIPTAAQQSAWKGLLTSNATPALSGVATFGGLSLMAKLSLSAAALLAVGVTTVLIQTSSAEEPRASAPPPPAPKPAVAAAAETEKPAPAAEAHAEAPWKVEMRKKLARKMTFEFVDTSLVDAVTFFRKTLGVNVVVDPALVPGGRDVKAISLHVTEMSGASALKWITFMAGAGYELRDQAIFIRPLDKIEKPEPIGENTGGSPEPWRQELQTALKRKVSFEFVDTPLADAIAFISAMTKANIIVEPRVATANPAAISLRVADMDVGVALEWIVKLCDLSYDLRDEAILIGKDLKKTEPAAPVKPPEAPKPAPRAPGDF